MNLAALGHVIQSLSLFTAVRESALVYPVLLSTHLACIATFGGLILATDLRLLGWFLTDIPADQVIGGLRPWKQAGFVVMVTCGLLLGGSKAEEYLANPFFLIKMAFLMGVGVHGLSFGRSVYRRREGPIPPGTARAAAVISIVLWLGVISMGRWIAYSDRPVPSQDAAMVDAR